MALRPWSERCAEGAIPPQPMRMQSAPCTIGGNSPTSAMGIIEDTPGNTPLNRANGALRKLPGSYSTTGQLENPYNWINGANLAAPIGQMDPSNG